MEVTRTELQNHVTRVNAVLQDACDSSSPAPLAHLVDGTISLAGSCPRSVCREVTTDLGVRELALRLPIPDTENPHFWIALQEHWRWKSKHRVSFVECGLRLYIGYRSEAAVQFLRLEWVAPDTDAAGVQVYQGIHAGHPHWHIDRSALVGQEDHLRSLEVLTSPPPDLEAEEFDENATPTASQQPLFDFSWIQHIHLPARAKWMESEWDGIEVPGPHQCEPSNLDELTHWWAGALRYFTTELPR
jgi:hypothetical protein